MTMIDFDPIEQRSPDLQRLRRKLEKLHDWLDQHDTPKGRRHPKWHHRNDVYMTTLRKYEQTYDAEKQKGAPTPTFTQSSMVDS